MSEVVEKFFDTDEKQLVTSPTPCPTSPVRPSPLVGPGWVETNREGNGLPIPLWTRHHSTGNL